MVDRFADQVIEHGVGEGVLRRGAGPDRDPPLTDVEVTGQDQLTEQGGGQAKGGDVGVQPRTAVVVVVGQPEHVVGQQRPRGPTQGSGSPTQLRRR